MSIQFIQCIETFQRRYRGGIEYCMAGKRVYPPEDYGESWGYERLKEILKDPKHKEYKEIKGWIGIEDVKDRFHTEKFDLGSINEILS